MAVTPLHRYRMVRHQVVPERAGLGPARCRPRPRARRAGSREASSARCAPTEVTLPCAMLAAPALASSPRLPALLHFALSLTDWLWGLIPPPSGFHIYISIWFKEIPISPSSFQLCICIFALLTTSLCVSGRSIRNTYLEKK